MKTESNSGISVSPPEVTVNCFSEREHLSQILTGFILLEKKGLLRLKIRRCFGSPLYRFHSTPLLEVVIGARTLIYDAEDGYPDTDQPSDNDWMAYYLPRCDYYFKRSYNEEINRTRYPAYEEKILPLGLNCYVTCANNPYFFRQKDVLGKARTLVSIALGKSPLLSPAFYRRLSDSKKGNAPDVIFMTRVWRPNDRSLQGDAQRRRINEARIRLIRTLKDAFGPRFLGGLIDDAYAREIAPDLILPRRVTGPAAYLRLMRSARVCVATTGLHDSIGWKFAEYVSTGKCIVSEPLRYSAPSLTEGVHYHIFTSAEEAAAVIQSLLDDPDARRACEDANRAYYNAYLVPDVLIARSLNIIGVLS